MISLKNFEAQARELARLGQDFYRLGWVPATSSNFSVRSQDKSEWVIVSQSGKDKSHLTPHDFMVVDYQAKAVMPTGGKPSAEALLHTTLYEYSDIGAVLHTHSLNAVLASELLVDNGHVIIQDLELIKAFHGQKTHEQRLKIPVFANTQDIASLSRQVTGYIATNGLPVAYLIAGHGVYAWGASVADAKRHLEALDYLFEYRLRRKANGGY